MSDPISQTGARYPGGCHHLLLMKKSRSDNEAFDAGVDKYQDTVEAGTFEDGQWVSVLAMHFVYVQFVTIQLVL